MELAQLRAFRTVAETLNFTRAAERLNLTQSAVSRQIGALEADFGEPLFVRGRRVVRLTAFGEIVLGEVTRILEDLDALRDRAGAAAGSPSGQVRAAAATQAFVSLFAPVFQSFIGSHPSIVLSFRTTATTDQTVSDILDGVVDVGFASRPVYAPQLKIVPLFEDELLLVVAPDHRLAGMSSVRAEDIGQQRVILFERGASIRTTTDEFFARGSVAPDAVLESNDTFFIKLMVRQGVGVSLLPAWAVREEVEAGTLARVPVEGHPLKRIVHLVTGGRALSSPTRVFVDYIIEQRMELQELARGGV